MHSDAPSDHSSIKIQFFLTLTIVLMSILLAGCGLEDTQPLLPDTTILPVITESTVVVTPTAPSPTATIIPPTATNTPTPTVATLQIGVVNVGAAYLRAGSATQNRIVGYAYEGDQLLILQRSEDGEWLRIDYMEEAWIAAHLVDTSLITVTPGSPALDATTEITGTLTISLTAEN